MSGNARQRRKKRREWYMQLATRNNELRAYVETMQRESEELLVWVDNLLAKHGKTSR